MQQKPKYLQKRESADTSKFQNQETTDIMTICNQCNLYSLW
jgi:hypothetical protein